MSEIDFNKDQDLFSIRKDGEVLGYISIENGQLTTTGTIGNNTYENWVELIKGLWGFDIALDHFFT